MNPRTTLPWVPVAFGLVCIAGCAALAGTERAPAELAFLGRTESLTLSLGYLGWELSFVYAFAGHITLERTTRLPATLLRRGSLPRWIGAEVRSVALSALGYSAASAVIATVVVMLLGSQPDWTPPAAVLVIGGGALQLSVYALVLLAALLAWPSPLASLIALSTIAAAAFAARSIPFPIPVQAAATAWISDEASHLVPILVMLILVLGVIVAAVLLRHRLRPFDL